MNLSLSSPVSFLAAACFLQAFAVASFAGGAVFVELPLVLPSAEGGLACIGCPWLAGSGAEVCATAAPANSIEHVMPTIIVALMVPPEIMISSRSSPSIRAHVVPKARLLCRRKPDFGRDSFALQRGTVAALPTARLAGRVD